MRLLAARVGDEALTDGHNVPSGAAARSWIPVVTSGGSVPWARIGEHVGQRNLAVTANTYSHVLADEAELDYRDLLEHA
jgi:hypothetical protein